MIRSFKERRDSDEGFTLIELMVVVLIIGILLAIAVPTFLNAQNNAKAKAATSNLRTSLSAVKTVYADKQTYLLTSTDLTAGEPSLKWVAGATGSTVPEEIAFLDDATTMSLATRSKLGFCYFIYDNVSGTTGSGTLYGKSNASQTTACMPTAAGTTPTTSAVSTATTWASSTSGAGW